MFLVELATMAILFVIGWLIIAFVFWIAGRIVSGMNATFRDALIVSLVGNIISAILEFLFDWFVEPLLTTIPFGGLLSLIIPAIIVLFVYVWLIMKFFDTGILGAIAVGLLVIIIWIGLAIVLGMLVVAIFVILGLLGP